jgi:hypothetical protein
MKSVIRFTLLVLAVAALAIPVAAQQADHQTASNPLVQLLQSKGILTAEEAASVGSASSPGEANERLAHLLLNKGLISQEEYNSTAAASAVPVAGAQAAPGGAHMVNAAVPASPSAAAITPKSAPDANGTTRPDTSRWPVSPNMVGYDPSDGASVDAQTIPAIAPVRVLPIGIPKDPKGIIPDIKLGSGAMLNPYGFFKASAVYDSTNTGGSANDGNDFPLPLLQGDTGPNAGSQFRVKARSARFGTNFYWPLNGPNITLTGKLEFDWEGDYTIVSNRNVSSVRSSQASLRLAWMRMDTKIGGVPWFAEFGQDWTLLGSSTVMDLFETTGFGVWFGNFYERIPQFKTGLQFSAGDWKIEPEVALTLGAFGDSGLNSSTTSALYGSLGQIPTGFQNQSRYGATLGPASGEPGVQGRIVLDFPMNKSWKGVPNAELIVSGGHEESEYIVPRANLPANSIASLAAPTTPINPAYPTCLTNSLQCYFPRGLTLRAPSNAVSVEAQLPTPWFTVIAKVYTGDNLRFMFATQFQTVFADATGGASIIAVPPAMITSGSGGCTTGTPCTPPNGTPNQSVLALSGDAITFINTACATTTPAPAGCIPKAAPMRPVRGYGGVAQVGIPLSRIFGANPEGYNAGWTMYFGYGVDGARNKDLVEPLTAPATSNGARPGLAFPVPLRRSDYVPFSLRYKMNKWAQFVNEATWYDTRTATKVGAPGKAGTPYLTLYRGIDARLAHDWREEFGTIFTF